MMGMHRIWKFQIKKYLKDEGNVLKILFHSPTKFIEAADKKQHIGGSEDAMRGFPQLRKAHCMGSIIVPEAGIKNNKLTVIPGTPPNLKHPPEGCRFADRCKYVKPECKVLSVPEKEFGNGRMYRCTISIEKLKEVYADE